MNIDEWQNICDETINAMIEYVGPYLTPISYEESAESGRHHGTGAYLEVEGEKYIITNEHVAVKSKYVSLGCQFVNKEEIVRLNNKFYCRPHPVDIAISKIDTEIWNKYASGSAAIPLDRFAKLHNPVRSELLFFAGYSGERSLFSFGYLITRGTPYLTQESSFPDAVDEARLDYHFSLFYPPDLARSVGGSSHLPNPHGFSGSLVWDTKRVECYYNDVDWKPDMAQVTGMVWGWPSSSVCILATRVDKFSLSELVVESRNNG